MWSKARGQTFRTPLVFRLLGSRFVFCVVMYSQFLFTLFNKVNLNIFLFKNHHIGDIVFL